jgi:hypothetical protein
MRRALGCSVALLACWKLANQTPPASYFHPLLTRRDIFSGAAASFGPHLLHGPIARSRDDAFEVWEETYANEGPGRHVEFAKFGENNEVQVRVSANPSRLESVHPGWATDNSWHAVARSRGQRLSGTSFRVADGLAVLDVLLETRETKESLTLMAHAGTLWTLSCEAETSRWAAYCPQVMDSFRPGFDQWARW